MSAKSLLPKFAGVSALALIGALSIGSFTATSTPADAAQSFETAQNFSTSATATANRNTKVAGKKRKKKRKKKRRRRGSYYSG